MTGGAAAAAGIPRKGIREGAASKLTELMHAMGSAKGFDPIPPDQYLTLRDKRYPPGQRLLWWLHSKTIRHGHRSPYAVDDQGRELWLKHAAVELDMDGGNIRREWGELEREGRVRREGRRLYLNGAVTLPDVLANKKRSEVCTNTRPPYLMKQIKRLPPEQQKELLTRYEQETALEAKVLAEAVAGVRSIFDLRKDTLLSQFGVKKIRQQKRRLAESPLVPVLAEFVERSVQAPASPAVRVGTTPGKRLVQTSASLLSSEEETEEECVAESVGSLDIHKVKSSSSSTLEGQKHDDDHRFAQTANSPNPPPADPKKPPPETEAPNAGTASTATAPEGTKMNWAPEFLECARIGLHKLATQRSLFEQSHPEALPLPDITVTEQILQPWLGREIGFLDWLAYAMERRLGEKRKGFGYGLFKKDSIACANQWAPDRLLSEEFKFKVREASWQKRQTKERESACERCKDSGRVGSEFCACERGREEARRMQEAQKETERKSRIIEATLNRPHLVSEHQDLILRYLSPAHQIPDWGESCANCSDGKARPSPAARASAAVSER